MTELHTDAPDPEGYSFTYAMDENREPVALIVTRLTDGEEIGLAATREEALSLVEADQAGTM